MNKNEWETNLIDEIQSLPVPDYEKEFDRNKQEKMHENLMNFSRNFESKKRKGRFLNTLTAGLASVAALVLLSVILMTMGDGGSNNATVPQKASFETFFHQKMEEMQKQEKNYSYSLVHTELSAVHEDDAIAVFIENNHQGEQIFIAYFEKVERQWEWKQTRGAAWNSRMNWSSMNQKPYIYSGPLRNQSIKEVYAGDVPAKIIYVEGDKRFWYAISPVKDVDVMMVTETGDKVMIEEVKSEGKENTSTIDVNIFELSAEEKEVYSLFQKDLNLQHLSGLEPISIAKLYVQAGLDKKYDVQYALYTDREGYVQWSEEDDKQIPESDRGSKEQSIKQFKNIDKGTFIQTSDFEGYIKYDIEDGPKGFQMVKNENGVWQVAFLPIQ